MRESINEMQRIFKRVHEKVGVMRDVLIQRMQAAMGGKPLPAFNLDLGGAVGGISVPG